MKKKIIGLMAILSLFSLASCSVFDNIKNKIDDNNSNENIQDNLPEELLPDTRPTGVIVPTVESPGKYEVIYDFNNGYYAKSTVTDTNLILEPKNPTKLCAKFICWCSDEALTKEFDFTKSVHKDTTIYAKYEIDYMALSNEIASSTLKANVRILGQFTNLSARVRTSLGSGIIVHEDESYYYALTNHHVIYKPEDSIAASYKVLDAYLNEYDLKASDIVSDVNYDLAIIRFRKSHKNEPLYTVDIAHDPLSNNETVIAIGEPLGLSNTITYGRVTNNNAPFTPDSNHLLESNVRFNVIEHTAPINSGSSGGALLDTNLNLVGINFASSTLADGKPHKAISCTIPLPKVLEFIKNSQNK